ncbi:MAG: sigma 54-interacting transcriptional regulator [Candidatus Methylomirabilales bacterium]
MVHAKETHGEASHEPGPSQDPPAGGLAGLVCSLGAIGHALQEAFDPQQFLKEFSAHVQRLLPHDRLMIAYLEDEGRTFTVFAEYAAVGPLLHEGHYTIAFDPGGRYTPNDWDLWPVFAGEAALIKDFQVDAGFAGGDSARFRALKAGIRCRVGVPLHSGGRAVGALFAASFTPDVYTEGHVATARQVADLIGPFIENIVLLHQEQRRRRRLGVLAGLPRVFGASLNVKDIFDRLAEAVRPVLDFDVMGAGLLGPGGRDLELLGRVDDDPSFTMPGRLPLEHFSFAATVEAGDTVLHRDVRVELDPMRQGDRMIIDSGRRANLCVPLWFGEEVGGALFFGKRKPNWFDQADVEIANGIAAQVVLAVQHQRFAEEQRRLAVAEERARKLEQRLASLRDELGERYGFHQILGRSAALREVLARAERVAPTETTVLLTGESGTGKELVARAIHYASPRAEGPFLAINCAALPETLLESELFGHEKGAFTGADRQKAGRFELAAGGTLFLDEVGELSPAVQAKLLRVVQEREFERVGGRATLRADVRIITATNRDLERAVAAGQFREDLFYRLNVFAVHLPPLRERGDDVLLLAEHFVRELGPQFGRGNAGLSREAREALLAHAWPGNIRELQNAVERALIMTDGGLITAAQLAMVPRAARPAEETPHDGRLHPEVSATPDSLPELEKRMVLDALAKTKGNKSRAAKLLGVTRFQLYTRLKRYGLDT